MAKSPIKPNILTGTSGWSNRAWVPEFYPSRLKAGEWLAHYATQLPSVEVNSSFYRLPEARMVAGWREKTPADFRFAVKAWKRITHERKLRNCALELEEFLSAIAGFGDKLGTILFQLPPKLDCNLEVLADFLRLLPQENRYCFEFRHDSWFHEGTYALLRQHGIALCRSHLIGWTSPAIVTAPFTYTRLHGAQKWFVGIYDEAFLRELAAWITAEAVDGYVYFNNTMGTPDAVHNAARLLELCNQA